MNRDIKFNLKEISESSGCYIFKDLNENVIYIGKAKNLRKRIKSHFQENEEKKRNFIPKVNKLETFVTTNSKEAFILEQNLIKKYQPRYNVLLKHSNYYPYIIMTSGKFPKYIVSYKYSRKEGDESFGPFPDGSRAREVLSLLEKIFPLSKCEGKKTNKKKPCIYYEMGQCSGSCFKEVPKEYYDSIKEKVFNFFNGKTKEIKSKIKSLIEKNNKAYSFEESKKQKKILDSIDFITSKQSIEIKSTKNKDFWGVFSKNNVVSMKILIYRYGKFLTSYDKVINLNNIFQGEEEAIESVIIQFYKNNICPQEIILSKNLVYKKEIEKILKSKIIFTRLGKSKEILELANQNAKEVWDMNSINNFEFSNKLEVLEKLRKLIKIEKQIYRLEALDISNISLEDSVGCFSLFVNGDYESSKFYELEKKKSDLEYIELSLMNHFSKNKNVKTDLLIVDGGKMQVKTVIETMKKMNIKLEIIGLVKDSNHKTSAIIDKNLVELNFVDNNMKIMMSRIQETVHNKAIGFHRKIHIKKFLN